MTRKVTCHNRIWKLFPTLRRVVDKKSLIRDTATIMAFVGKVAPNSETAKPRGICKTIIMLRHYNVRVYLHDISKDNDSRGSLGKRYRASHLAFENFNSPKILPRSEISSLCVTMSCRWIKRRRACCLVTKYDAIVIIIAFISIIIGDSAIFRRWHHYKIHC